MGGPDFKLTKWYDASNPRRTKYVSVSFAREPNLQFRH